MLQRCKRGFRRCLRPLAIGAVLAAVVWGGLLAHRFVVESPHFHVHRVDVSPTVHVTADEIRGLTRIHARVNIFTVDLEAVANRVAKHPWIARAKAHRRLPNTIRIEVVEHEPVAAVLFDGSPSAAGAFYLVNQEGRPFKRASVSELDGLPLITGVSRSEYRRRPKAAAVRIRESLEAAALYRSRSGRPPLGEIHTDPVEGLSLYTARQAVQIRLGRSDVSSKLKRLDRILKEMERRGQRPLAIRLDNEQHPRRVTVRLAETDEGTTGHL